MNIETQKNIADEIYSKLKVIDPYCLLAGGAPRDWYLGKEANDLDFYFYSNALPVESTRKQLEYFFDGLTLLMDKDGGRVNPMYKTMPFIQRIWELNYKGMPVQLIQLTENQKQFKVVDSMDVSICKAWYMSGRIRLHEDFKITLASKVMFLKEEYSWSDKHGQKMKDRFKGDFHCGTKEQAIKTVLRKQLDNIDV